MTVTVGTEGGVWTREFWRLFPGRCDMEKLSEREMPSSKWVRSGGGTDLVVWREKSRGDLIHCTLDRFHFRGLGVTVIEMYKRDLQVWGGGPSMAVSHQCGWWLSHSIEKTVWGSGSQSMSGKQCQHHLEDVFLNANSWSLSQTYCVRIWGVGLHVCSKGFWCTLKFEKHWFKKNAAWEHLWSWWRKGKTCKT